MSGNRLLGSYMVDMGISSSNMKSPSPKCSMTLLDMTIHSDTLHWSEISLNRDLITELCLITDFDLITKFWEVSIEYLQWVRPSNRGYLLLQTPGPVPFGTFFLMLRPFSPELVMFPDFEFRTTLGTSILLMFKAIMMLFIKKNLYIGQNCIGNIKWYCCVWNRTFQMGSITNVYELLR